MRPLTQAVSLSITTAGAASRATATATPARAGRGLVLQRQNGTGWVTAATGKVDAHGRSVVTVPTSATTRYRVVAAGWNGALAVESSAVGMKYVDIPDAILLKCVDKKRGLSSGTRITITQAVSTKGLSCAEAGTVSLQGIQGFTHLTTLYIFENQIRDVAPLRGLTNLSTLGLSGNPIRTKARIVPASQSPGPLSQCRRSSQP